MRDRVRERVASQSGAEKRGIAIPLLFFSSIEAAGRGMPENPGRPSLSPAEVSTIGPPEALEADSCARRPEKCRLRPKISRGIAIPLVYFRISFNAGRVTRQIHRPGKEAPWLANRRQRNSRICSQRPALGKCCARAALSLAT